MIPRTIPYLYAFWLAVLAVFAACQAVPAEELKSLRAQAIAEPIVLDGFLNDPQWRDVQAATGGGDNWGVLRVRRRAVPTVLTLRASAVGP